MRPSRASIFVLPISALQIPSIFTSFYEPQLESLISNETLITEEHELLKRDGTCPANYDSCSTLKGNYGGACCTAGTFCTTDHARNIACCPTGATCTGTVATTTGAALGGGTTTTTGGATVTSAASLVPNSYFPFPYIPTTYPNSAACLSAYSDCQTNFAACTNDLQGNSFGVTIVAPNGAGVTVAPTAQNLGSASAASICGSLSAVGCYNIQTSNCAVFGTGTNTGSPFIAGTTNAAARPTMGCMAAAGMAAGVGLGIAGQLV